ncbi:Phosphoribosylamine-glycine ligase [Nitrospira defluvii]|uniref:Phosphoribosylamine--glycine ligase n=1 Tax=Nitrospira defluvii TaxID=330214 RepID=D8PG94_9BACT|nr:Phosphoribosylamine-glycine ligase [Nitrospira defluvii]
MKILVVGGGGREHAMVWKIAQSPRKPEIFCAPGNAGIEGLAICVPIKADDIEGLKAFALKEQIDLTVVGPEAPLALGIADEFRKARLKIFGPTKAAARLESSKSFSKDIMAANRIPTAAARSFERMEQALAYLDEQPVPIVVKADGLAQGKGVVVATTREEATQAVRDAMEKSVFGQAGHRVLIEEFLDGEELTLMAFTDGKTVVPMVPAQDHKRVGDGDSGPNTGGMGAYAPAPIATAALREQVTRQVLQPTVDALARLGSPFQGVLYAGLMVVKGTPYVLEFNARMGDPETEVVLPLLKTDLVEVMEAVVEHRLDELTVEWHPDTAVCVVMTSPGYPGAYPTGLPIQGLPTPSGDSRVAVFHAGTKRDSGRVVTAGGRVLAVTAWGPSLLDARAQVYQAVPSIVFEGRHYRTDIAHRALPHKI